MAGLRRRMAEPAKLLDRVRIAIRTRHYSPRTEEAYVKRHPSSMSAGEVNAFLSHLAISRTVSVATQSQGLEALLFLDRNVLAELLPWIANIVWVQRPARLPVVLSVDEVRAVLERTREPATLVVQRLHKAAARIISTHADNPHRR